MSDSYGRATEIIADLTRAGIRATMDPSAANPPVVLVVPPSRRYDVSCGYTARWQLVALAPGAQGADRTTWAALDELADAVADVVDVQTTELVAYALNGTTYPAYLCTCEEIISS